MSEDEAGFTFVDKRRIVSQDQAGGDTGDESSSEFSSSGMTDSAVDSSDSSDAGEPEPHAGDVADDLIPDVYMMVQECARMLAAFAWHKMGLVPDPRTGKPAPDLAQAKVAIDTVGDLIGRLESAPASAVDPTLRRDLRTLLRDLRLNFVNQQGMTEHTVAGR